MLPKGMATFLPEAAVHKRNIEETILSVFLSWGYREVIPPIFEYLDVITRGLGPDLVEKGYKFVDRATGRLMLLRPDITPQIARMAAMLMADVPKPLRLCYRANVFRHEEEHAGRARELFQIGGELIGPDGPGADAEIISLAVESLKRIGLRDFKIALGQVQYFRGLIDDSGLAPEFHPMVHDAVIRRDRSWLLDILKQARIGEVEGNRILSILALFGGEDVLERAGGLADRVPACRTALERLKGVYEILVSCGWKEHIILDLADVRGLDYYTGTIFEIFCKDLGVPLGRGGRYDSLIGKFGNPSPSTGFAFNMEQVQAAWLKSGAAFPAGPAEVMVVDSQGDPVRLFSVSQALRGRGLRVTQHAETLDPKEALSRGRLVAAEYVLLLTESEKGLLIHCGSGSRNRGKISSLLSRIPKGKR